MQDFNTLIQTAAAPTTSVANLLDEASLLSALKSEIFEIFKFFSSEEHVEELLEWSLSSNYSKDLTFPRRTQIATHTLSMRNPTLQYYLYNTSKFKKTIKHFFDTPCSHSSFYCAHFVQIFIPYLQYTRGQCLEKMSGLRESLLRRLHILPIRELFLHIVLKFDDKLLEPFCDYPLIAPMVAAGGVLAQGVISAITELIKYSKFRIFTEDVVDFVEALLSVAVNQSEPTISRIQAFRIAAAARDLLIPSENSTKKSYDLLDLEDLFREYEKYYSPSDGVAVKAAAFLVFDGFLSEAFELFVKQPQNTFLAQAVISGIRRLDNTSLLEFVQRNSVIQKIMEKTQHKTVGQFTEIALHLYRRKICSNVEWISFVKKEVAPKVELMISPYGGQKPSN